MGMGGGGSTQAPQYVGWVWILGKEDKARGKRTRGKKGTTREKKRKEQKGGKGKEGQTKGKKLGKGGKTGMKEKREWRI
jgi:hypothetical protein